MPKSNCPCVQPASPCSKCRSMADDNVWVERAHPGALGVCLLDTLTEEQVIHVLSTVPGAAADLKKITLDPRLLYLAETVKLWSTTTESDRTQRWINSSAQSIPFYTQFAGKPPHVR